MLVRGTLAAKGIAECVMWSGEVVSLQRQSYEIARCLVCGAHQADVLGDIDDFRTEIEALWAYHEPRLRPGTPPCLLVDRVAFSQQPPLRLVRCHDCGLVYRNPVEPSAGLASAYARDTPAPAGLEALHRSQLASARAQARRVRRLLGRGATGVEVGSYVGAFLVAAGEAGLNFEGIDVNPAINLYARTRGVRVHDGELRDYPSRPLDVIAIWNTFDQLADPRGVAVEGWRRLRPGGLLALRVPNGALYARLRRALLRSSRAARVAARAFLAQSNLLGFPYRWGFTVESLTGLLRQAGFTIVRVRGDALVRTSDEWTRPWARLEERVLKGAMAAVGQAHPSWAPWLEVFATRNPDRAQAASRRIVSRI